MANMSNTQGRDGRDGIHMTLARRAVLLCACLGAGFGIGYAGQTYTGDSAWFLALPVCLLTGWLFVADPTQCVRPRDPPTN